MLFAVLAVNKGAVPWHGNQQRTNHSIRAKRKSIYSFRSYAAIDSRVPFRCWFPYHGTLA